MERRAIGLLLLRTFPAGRTASTDPASAVAVGAGGLYWTTGPELPWLQPKRVAVARVIRRRDRRTIIEDYPFESLMDGRQ
jgi:hypothetical protein